MTGFLIRAGRRVVRVSWSWGFVKFVLWVVTLTVLLYVEEDWRGNRAWAAIRTQWEARGESFDLNKFVPPPVPDDRNLAALPLFKMEPEQGSGFAYPIALRKAMRYGRVAGGELPPMGNWMNGRSPDWEKIRLGIATDYAAAFPGARMPDGSLAQFDALYPFLADLRVASAGRPLCRFDLDYTSLPPAGRPLGLLTDQITLSKLLAMDAILELHERRADQALADIRVNYTLLLGAERNPTLVGGLVALGMNAICTGAIYAGLALHAWDDAQLGELEQILGRIRYLDDYQFDVRSTAAESITNIEYFKEYASRADRRGLFVQAADRENAIFINFIPRWPDGWWDNNKSQMATFLFGELATVDPRAGVVFPKVDIDRQRQIDEAGARCTAWAPWNIWFTISAPPLGQQTVKFAYGQTWVDEARMGCALERYRLAHAAYPESLDALVPEWIAALPRDVINGQPYHYRLRPEGTYLLYSVGWNQTDDGAKIVLEKGSSLRIDNTKGDWVWPEPGATP